MRERLIELFRNVNYQNRENGMTANLATQFTEYALEQIVDALISEGVIVTPCKVGTTLYFIYNNPYADKPDLTPRIYKTNNWYFEVDKTGIVINTSDIHSFNKQYDYHLGETVFLTREEAEKALKGAQE